MWFFCAWRLLSCSACSRPLASLCITLFSTASGSEEASEFLPSVISAAKSLKRTTGLELRLYRPQGVTEEE